MWRELEMSSSAVCGRGRQVIVSSSGAAYGYHADNPEQLD